MHGSIGSPLVGLRLEAGSPLQRWPPHSFPTACPPGQPYLELGQLLAVVQDAEGVEVVRARVWDHLTAHQVEGLLGCLAPVPVLVEVQVIAPDRAPA